MESNRDSENFSPWFATSRRDYTDFCEQGEELGRGAMSTVYSVKETGTGHEFVAKKIKKNSDKTIMRTEVGMLLRIKQPNLVRMHHVFETKQHIILILDKVTGGELFDRIVERDCYTEQDAAECLRQILLAIAYLHEKDIVHGNLKPENLLYATSDSDSALKVSEPCPSKPNGKTMPPGYVAPELLMGKAYDTSVDSWSVGVIAYILLSGYEPFYDDRGDSSIFQRVLKCDFEFQSPWWDEISTEAKEFVSKLIVLDPKKRITAKQALAHPWLKRDSKKDALPHYTIDHMKDFNVRRKKKAGSGLVGQMSNMLKGFSKK